MKYFAIYIGDLRFTGTPLGDMYFDYCHRERTFFMRSDHNFSYEDAAVLDDDDFLIFKVSDEANPKDQTIEQVDKVDFVFEHLKMFN